MNSKPKPRVVIVGAGFAGLTAARRIARLPVQVTVVDRKNHHTFQPLLYQVATAGLSPGEIAAPIRWILRAHSNVEVLLEEVVDSNLEQRRVITKQQSPRLRLSDHRLRGDPCLFWTRRMGASGARFEDDCKRAGNPPPCSAGLRTGRASEKRAAGGQQR